MATEVARRDWSAGFDPAALVAEGRPLVLRGLARDWPLVRAAMRSPADAAAELKRFDVGRPVVGYVGVAGAGGRFHYRDDAQTLDFTSERTTLTAFLDRVLGGGEQALYLGSTGVDAWLPGLRAENDLAPAGDAWTRHPPLVSVWAGNRTVAAAHYDMSNNVAVCAAGRRRFTFFPPDQGANLYPGPLAPTPGGQVVTMVDLAAPDTARFPRFAAAEAAAQVVELAPGDAVVFPAMWWHQVEALDGFNVLVNYWWNEAPAFLDTPMDALLHALLAVRDRPPAERAAWRGLFDFYVFGDPDRPRAHLPEGAHGALATLDADGARRLRAYLLGRLNR